MSNPKRPDTGDDFALEASTLPSSADATSSPLARSPLEPSRTPRQRIIRLAATLVAGLVALAIILGSDPDLRTGVIGLFAGPTPTPTLLIFPTETRFYLLPTPPGVDVTLDGHSLTSLPLPGDPHPLQLAPGSHVFAWDSRLYPFMPLRCTISVPRRISDTCPLRGAPVGGPVLPAPAIAMQPSLATLPAGVATQLSRAIQDALYASRSTATVEPGERYYYYQAGQSGGSVAATQALRAALTYQYDFRESFPEPCTLAAPAIPCRFPGQDCTQLCTVPHPPSSVLLSPTDWIATAEVHASWNYTTLDGHVVASNLGEEYGAQLLSLRITWDGVAWSVTPLFGHIANLPASDDPVCDPARFWLGLNDTWSFMLDNPPPGAQQQFISDATPTDGCLILLNQQGAPPAAFLERFGLLLAVNDLAESRESGLPMADAAEQRLARQLAAQAQLTI